ncbi:transporter [Legionella yabuuchiae]|uniref:transporter n=1 Tax=Legionella yabuuchiae TaxID=376727 RepID=UPI001054D6A9|nr:transporter [Legionella yabuuchiae]
MVRSLLGGFFITLSSLACAEPWFTGPLLAPAGKTIPKGHVNFELYGFDTKNVGFFNRHWKLAHTPGSENYQINPIFTYGLAEKVDVQLSLPYVINQALRHTSHHIGDVALILGYQAWEQKNSKWIPNLRLTYQLSIPTGKFEEFNPANEGTDGTGAGSYQSIFALNFEHLLQFNEINYLRTRFILSHLYASPVHIRGFNAYGGNPTTNGIIKPSSLTGIDLAGEFTVTKHWVAVMEGYYFNRGATSFHGFRGLPVRGVVPIVGHPNIQEISLAPAVEFNVNEHFGIIGGYWFSVRGKDAPDFRSTVVAFNAYW